MKSLFSAIVGLSVLLAAEMVASAQIYVACQGSNSIAAFNEDGTPINTSLVTGLSAPNGLVLVGDTLFVTNNTGTTLGAYTTSGTVVNSSFASIGLGGYGIATNGSALWVSNVTNDTVNAYSVSTGQPVSTPPLVSGLSEPRGVAVSGNVLYVANTGTNRIESYNATTGAAITSINLGLDEPRGIAVSGSRVYVSNFGNGKIGVYDAATLNPINVSFISGPLGPIGLKVKGDKLYIADSGLGTIGVYDATTGAAINASLITGLNNPYDIALPADPIPSPPPAPPLPSVRVIGKKKITTAENHLALKGTASATAARVEVKVGSKAYKKARGTSHWKFTAKLKPGRTIILVHAVDSSGQPGSAVKIIVRHTVPQTL